MKKCDGCSCEFLKSGLTPIHRNVAPPNAKPPIPGQNDWVWLLCSECIDRKEFGVKP